MGGFVYGVRRVTGGRSIHFLYLFGPHGPGFSCPICTFFFLGLARRFWGMWIHLPFLGSVHSLVSTRIPPARWEIFGGRYISIFCVWAFHPITLYAFSASFFFSFQRYLLSTYYRFETFLHGFRSAPKIGHFLSAGAGEARI